MRPGRLRAVRWTELAIVFQGALHTLNPVQRVGSQIAEAIRLHSKDSRGGAASKRVGELLELVGLPARRARDYPHQLSGGQRQRVLIALALACDPRLLIADEPTTALDVMVQAQVLRLLEDLQERFGLAVVFITHDLSTLAAVCRRLAVMYAGRIVEQGPSEAVFEDPAHPYTRGLAAAFPVIGDRAFRMNPSGLPGDPPDPRELPSGCPFHPRCPAALEVCSSTRRRAVAGGRRALGGLRPRPRLTGADVKATRRCSRSATCTSSSPGAGGARRRRRGPLDAQRRDRRAGGRVGLWQDDARARRSSGCSARRGRGARARRAAALRPPRAARAPPHGADDLPGPDRRAERAPDDLRGGRRGRAHPEARGRRGEAGGRGARARRPAAAGALLHPLPVRALRRPAPARGDRGRDGAAARACWSPTSRSRASTPRCAARSWR